MAVQTRSVLKTYFETGDKPTAAQFGDLIDSVFSANVQDVTAASTLSVMGGVVYNAIGVSGGIYINGNALNIGESFVLNRGLAASHANSIVGAAFGGAYPTEFYTADGYANVSATATGIMSYAFLALSGADSPTFAGSTHIVLLVNRAWYYKG